MEVDRSTTGKRVMLINIIRAVMYFSVVGIQWIHCSTESVTCSAMIILVPLFLGVIDALLIWASRRDSWIVRLLSIVMSIASITVATITLAPIMIETGLLSDYQFFMLIISLGVLIISVIEVLVVVTDLATRGEKDEIVLEGSIRTYGRWESS